MNSNSPFGLLCRFLDIVTGLQLLERIVCRCLEGATGCAEEIVATAVVEGIKVKESHVLLFFSSQSGRRPSGIVRG